MESILRKWRLENDVTQQELGSLVGVPYESIGKWERGTQKIPPTRVPKLSEITGIPRIKLRPDLPELFA